MIEFHCKRKKSGSNSPILSNVEIEKWTETILLDYKPQLLKEPGRLNAFYFLENYLEATLEFHDIYYEENQPNIIGASAFNNEYIKVFDHENMCVGVRKIAPRTVVLDNSIMTDDKTGLAAFTALHEGGHLFLHPAVYTKTVNDQPFGSADNLPQIVCCRRYIIENGSGKPKNLNWTEEDFREHQANVFAASIAMPKRTFIPYAQQLILESGLPMGYVVEGNYEYDMYELPSILNTLAQTYGVSKSAAFVSLKKYGLHFNHEPSQSDLALSTHS